jgi:hypothetical protein
VKLKLFMSSNPPDIEQRVNEWLIGDKIEVLRTEMTMNSVAEKPDDGTYPCIVIAIWYVEKAT